MRLLDQGAQCCLPTLVEHDDGARFELTGAGAFSRDVIECPKRYVLDDRASRLTRDFLHVNLALFSPQDRFVRLSAPSLWLEWWEPPADASTGGRPVRVGALCRSDATGRRGRVRSFWAKDEHVSAPPGDIVFDRCETVLGRGAPVSTTRLVRRFSITTRSGLIPSSYTTPWDTTKTTSKRFSGGPELPRF